MLRIISVLLLLLNSATASSQNPPKPPVPRTTAELRQQIEKVLKDTHTPGAGVAIVRREA